jgi:DNA repair protein RadC
LKIILNHLQGVPFIGTPFKAETMFLLAEISISYKPLFKLSERPQIKTSTDAFNILKSAWSEDLSYCEEFLILLLNRSNKVLGVSKISVGGIAGTIADPKKIFQSALKANASGLILAHNHPSGNLKPSEADLSLTKKIKEAGKFLDLEVIDHIILTDEAYFSFGDEGLM